MKKYLYYFGVIVVSILAGADAAFAEAGAGSLYLPLGIGLTLGLAAIGGTFAQGKAVSSALDSIGRNPSSRGELMVPMLLGLAFVESLVIFAFVISYFLLDKF